ncbi:MAG: hypothetical protein ACWGQW_13160 [bacterium]
MITCDYSIVFMVRLLQLGSVLLLATCLSPTTEIDGTWNFIFTTPDGDLRMTATLKAEGEELTFEQDGKEVLGSYKDGEFKIVSKDYYSDAAGYSSDLILDGEITGDELSGKWTFDVYSGTFSAKRSGS